VVGFAVAGAITLGIWAASGWLATHWVTPKHLSPGVVAHAFTMMGLVAALRFLQDLYLSGSIGLQRQVQQNIVLGITATVRGLGAVALLAWVSPTITVFFLWQGLISIITVALFAGIVYRALPHAPLAARFSGAALLKIWRFAAGIVMLTLLALLFSQLDKILLSRMLSLEAFGYYALAGVVASSLSVLTGPITTALYPRFTEMSTNRDDVALSSLYHQGAQLVTVLIGSAAIVLMMFGYRVLRLWTGDPSLAQKVTPLMVVIALSVLCNSLLCVPYQMQLAYGWTSLTVQVNTAAVCVMVPAILLVVPRYGAMGGAWMLVATNAGCLLLEVPLMHRRLLPAEMWRWYSWDVAVPLAAATATAFLCRWAMPHDLGKFGEFSVLLITSICVLIAAAAVAPTVRSHFTRYLSIARLKHLWSIVVS
jgi:O-antigen/teichoic acid export membrane protein